MKKLSEDVKILDKALANKKFLVGDKLTLADINVALTVAVGF
jgi:glutathione S-transferase